MTRLTRNLGLALLILMILARPLAAAQVAVTVPAETTVDGPRLTLGAMAEITLLNPAGADLAEKLAALDLGPAPAAGQTLALRRAQLEQRLTASRLDLSETTWQLPEELRLTGRGQELSQDTLRRALTKYLAETEPYQSGKFELVSVNFSDLPTLPPGQTSYRFAPQASTNPTYLSGAFFFAVDGREVARARVTAQIDLSIPAVVATRTLSKGQVLTETDLSLTLAPFAQAKGALTSLALTTGATLKTSLTTGEVVKERHLTKSLMVRRGDAVTIIAQQGGLRVTDSGLAKQDGALGETIPVLNQSSKKTISGRIIGPNQVEIVF
ncbi:MAG: flagellar basal body P-ring formation chaperone FlgA [Candidatus Adiutrix sp.]|nr:flagellar basal body P-ring formation chaperone FlgA [Candidatus Adiutrix sp.]